MAHSKNNSRDGIYVSPNFLVAYITVNFFNGIHVKDSIFLHLLMQGCIPFLQATKHYILCEITGIHLCRTHLEIIMTLIWFMMMHFAGCVQNASMM